MKRFYSIGIKKETCAGKSNEINNEKTNNCNCTAFMDDWLFV